MKNNNIRIILPVVCLAIILSGCQNTGNGTGGDTGNQDTQINALDQADEKVQAMDADVLFPIDGVTMEVLDCTDTSVTIRITNDTDKDINCGTDFHLNMLDEKTGEWRELDTVIDDAAFDAVAIMIQKDAPYETVIDFEWLYGKLKPGKYQIVKTVMDFRGTGDYTNYVYAAEFDILEK